MCAAPTSANRNTPARTDENSPRCLCTSLALIRCTRAEVVQVAYLKDGRAPPQTPATWDVLRTLLLSLRARYPAVCPAVFPDDAIG